eukprot:7489743-Karenia_brevis.AAC.1
MEAAWEYHEINAVGGRYRGGSTLAIPWKRHLGSTMGSVLWLSRGSTMRVGTVAVPRWYRGSVAVSAGRCRGGNTVEVPGKRHLQHDEGGTVAVAWQYRG